MERVLPKSAESRRRCSVAPAKSAESLGGAFGERENLAEPMGPASPYQDNSVEVGERGVPLSAELAGVTSNRFAALGTDRIGLIKPIRIEPRVGSPGPTHCYTQAKEWRLWRSLAPWRFAFRPQPVAPASFARKMRLPRARGYLRPVHHHDDPLPTRLIARTENRARRARSR